ncbi:hypothetical protein HGRIS_004881 [Hohenbuehelia grisea]|uniref:Uncharacterized protein n=1 Tax=Hohenbuehelia grisea TaxID=104357 RepID=A0ABR3JDX3_9AGAR
MPPRRARSSKPQLIDSESDNDAPEAISLTSSKQTARKESAALTAAQAAARQRTKEKNRARDRKLKERALETRLARDAVEEDGSARKRRKIEAHGADGVDSEGGEDSEDDGSASGRSESDEDGEEEFHGFGDAPAAEQDASSDEDAQAGSDYAGSVHLYEPSSNDDDGSAEEPENDLPNSSLISSAHHLPDHLFASAFASKPSPRSQSASTSAKKPAKRPRSGSKPKDIVVGSRVVRSLSNSYSAPSGAGTVPSRKVREFADRSLGLQGGRPLRMGSRRRPAHLGVLKTNGPPARFVRNSS